MATRCARVFVTCALAGLSAAALAGEGFAGETIGRETLGKPAATWFVAKGTAGPGFVFDAADARMLGTLSLTPFTPTVLKHPDRDEIYAAESYYTRRYRGERNDVLTVYARDTLGAVAEIDLPDKIASLNFPRYLSLLSDNRLLTVFNMTPAQSVSVVDVRQREFRTELSTPGCALMLPVPERGFLMLCGDGTLQLIRVDRAGAETARVRSQPFFSVDDDPVYDQPVPTPDGWLLLTYGGRVLHASVDGDAIRVSEPWSLLDDEDRGADWRVGGVQVYDLHRALDRIYVLMHQGGEDTHEKPGTELWVFDRAQRSRIARIKLEKPMAGVTVTQDDAPHLILNAALEPVVQVVDATTTRVEHTIQAGQVVGLVRLLLP